MHRSQFAYHSFAVAGPSLLNSLPQDIRDVLAVIEFCKRLKRHCLTSVKCFRSFFIMRAAIQILILYCIVLYCIVLYLDYDFMFEVCSIRCLIKTMLTEFYKSEKDLCIKKDVIESKETAFMVH